MENPENPTDTEMKIGKCVESPEISVKSREKGKSREMFSDNCQNYLPSAMLFAVSQ